MPVSGTLSWSACSSDLRLAKLVPGWCENAFLGLNIPHMELNAWQALCHG